MEMNQKDNTDHTVHGMISGLEFHAVWNVVFFIKIEHGNYIFKTNFHFKISFSLSLSTYFLLVSKK
jgi:hypothetical protein